MSILLIIIGKLLELLFLLVAISVLMLWAEGKGYERGVRDSIPPNGNGR